LPLLELVVETLEAKSKQNSMLSLTPLVVLNFK
jgi:hypothetical protein